jgi:tetratricopeptide (TPR) repeat protein
VSEVSLLVVHVESPNRGGEGDTVYRTLQPCRALGELPGLRVVSGPWLSPAVRRLAPEADALVLCMLAEADLLPVLARRRALRRLTVCEIDDDFLSPQPWNPVAFLARDPLARSLLSRLAAASDAIQLSAPGLERHYGHLGPRRALFPNHLWEMPAPAEKPPGLRLGWGGSVGHREDLREVLPVLSAALARHPGATLCLMAAPSFRELLSGLPPDRVEFTPGGSLEAYRRWVAALHVGICPLQPSDWNRSRSDVKWLEYASCGVVPLVADLDPYAAVRDGETGLRFRGASELGPLLDRVLGDAALRERIARGALAEARGRIERRHAPERLAFYRRAAAEVGATLEPRPHPELAGAGLDPGAEPYAGSRYLPAPQGRAEDLLHDGLVQARDGRTAEAVRLFAEAARVRPGDHLPWLYLGNAEPEPGRALEPLRRAAALAPGSPSAALALALRLEQAGRAEEARAELERCAALAPDLGAAQARLGEMAAAAGREGEALARQRAALAANAFLAPPAIWLGMQALRGGRAAEAEELLARSVAADGRVWQTRFLLGEALLALGRPGEAVASLEAALERTDQPEAVRARLAAAREAAGDLGGAEAARAGLGRPGPA